MLHKVVFNSHAPLAPLFILMIEKTIDAKFALFAGLKRLARKHFVFIGIFDGDLA